MNRIFIPLLKKEIAEQFRTGKFIVFAALFLLFGILSPLAAKYMPAIIGKIGESQNLRFTIPEPNWLDAVNQYLKNLTQICTFIVILLYMGFIAREKETGTVVFLLVKPVPRFMFLLAKFLSVIPAVFISMLLSFLAATFYIGLFFETLDFSAFAALNLIMFFYIISILFITLLFSSLFKSSVLAGIFSFLSWLLLSLASQLGKAGDFLPSALITQATAVIAGKAVSWEPFAGTSLLMIMCFLISYISFRNWEP